MWKGGNGGSGGVGMAVARKWAEEVVEVQEGNERIMAVKMVVGGEVWNVVSVYAPQSGRTEKEKESFYDALDDVVEGVGKAERVVIGGDFNGHVGEEVEGFEGVHGGMGFGKRNQEGNRLLEFADSREMIVVNTWFDKEEEEKVSYESGECRSVIDYFLVPKEERSRVIDAKAIVGEPCMVQHKLMVCEVGVGERGEKGQAPFVSKCKVWKLRESEVKVRFAEVVNSKLEGGEGKGNGVDGIWTNLKQCLLEGAEEVCGRTKKPKMHEETFWWNEECKEVVAEKRLRYKELGVAKKRKVRQEIEVAVMAYNQAKRRCKSVIGRVKGAAMKKMGEALDKEDSKGKLFKAVGQMTKKNRAVVGGGGLRDGDGRIVTEEEKIMEMWRSHFEKVSNEEFEWDRDSLAKEGAGEPIVESSIEEITDEEVRRAMSKMKGGKAPGPSGVGAELLSAAGEVGIKAMVELCNAIVREGRMPEDWSKSWLVSIYKGKGDAMDCGSYRGVKLLEHAMKVFERVIEARVRSRCEIDDMQFGFRAGRGTTDAIFVVRQMQEKFLEEKKELWMAFVDLEKAFDRVPRQVVWWALRRVGVEEGLVKVIQAMYEGAMTAVRVKNSECEGFGVKVGVHQGSVLSPLLFIIVLEAISRQFRAGLPFELLYADDLVLMAESEELLLEKLRLWKENLEAKGLRVNLGKTKVMRCCEGGGKVRPSGKFPCGVCNKGVRGNSIQCMGCKRWVHKGCSKIRGRLREGLAFECSTCLNGPKVKPAQDTKVAELLQGVNLEVVEEFCYLGDMIDAGGGAEGAARARVRCAWGKFNQLSPMLAVRGASLKVKGKIYATYVRSVMVYGSETWPMKAEDIKRLVRTERTMMRRMCGVKLVQRINCEVLHERLGLEKVEDVVRRGRLRWFGHVERMDRGNWVSKCRTYKPGGQRGKGRGKKTWRECVKDDLKEWNLDAGLVGNRLVWRSRVNGGGRACCRQDGKVAGR
jgi:Reverse transcriptase (RNA-dependent DNA polymerase)